MKKLVFSKEKWLEESKRIGLKKETIEYCLTFWVNECDGKTRKECSPMIILDEWLVEVDE